MSYSAFVVCNCYQKGKTTKPPFEEYVKFDEDGLYIDIPDEIWRKDEQSYYRIEDEFEEWKNNACEHKEMELCDEYLSNSLGMDNFKQIIRNLGGEKKYPTLTAHLPIANGGILPVNVASTALKELLELEKEKSIEERITLSEDKTNDLVATVNAKTYLIFVFTAGNKYNYGLDKNGFFILENIEENEEQISYVVFRSTNFLQITVSKEEFIFVDKLTDNRFFCSVNLHPYDENSKNLYEFSIKKVNAVIADEYNYMIEPLKKLVKASIKSRNPIHWC